jgi:hypothetical protein
MWHLLCSTSLMLICKCTCNYPVPVVFLRKLVAVNQACLPSRYLMLAALLLYCCCLCQALVRVHSTCVCGSPSDACSASAWTYSARWILWEPWDWRAGC